MLYFLFSFHQYSDKGKNIENYLNLLCSDLRRLSEVSLDSYITVYTLTSFCINIYMYIYRKFASRFSRGTVLNTLKQSRINILRGKKDVTTFPDKPVS